MLVILPAALIFGGITFTLVRGFRLKVWHAIIAALFGFCLATTGLGPAVDELIRAILKMLHVPVV